MKRILIATDAWSPQTNGVVRTLQTTIKTLEAQGHIIQVISPDLFFSLPCPFYPEIRLGFPPPGRLHKIVQDFTPDAIHISTEGPIGWMMRHYCRKHNINFSTSYHTKFPEYVSARFPVPLSWGYRIVQRFHKAATHTFVATGSLMDDLHARGFENLRLWSRGVDLDLFSPKGKKAVSLPQPVMLYIGRVAVEKNIEAFLELDLPGSKLIVGDGPARAGLEEKYPDAYFVGAKYGEELAAYYRSGDIFVFPSKSDTFGLVMLEAMASGLTVAAYPVTGPIDVIGKGGAMHEDLAVAIEDALHIPKSQAIKTAKQYSWQACTKQFLDNLVPL